MSENISEEITKGDSTPKVRFGSSVKNFFYGITFSASTLVMILRLIIYIAILTGIILTIIASAVAGSAFIFFEGLVTYVLIWVGLFTLTEIINRRKA